MRLLLALALVLLAPSLQAQEATVFRGQVVGPDAAALVGAKIKLTGRGRRGAKPSEAEAVSDAEGRFSLRLPTPPDYSVSLEVSSPGCARHTQRWPKLEPGETMELGIIHLQRAGVVTGRIVNATGEQVRGLWNISTAARATSFAAQLDPETGEFRLEGLPPTQLVLTGRCGRLMTEAATVEVQAGSEHFVELLYDGPDPGRQVSVNFLRGGALIVPLAKHVFLIGPTGDRHAPADGSDRFVFELTFEDLDPGAYQLVVDDPRFEDWTQDGVLPGASVTPKLIGSVALAIEVVDAQSGDALKGFAIEVEYESRWARGRTLPLQKSGEAPPADGIYPGIVALPLELTLTMAGRPNVSVQVEHLQPGETRPVRIEVPRATHFVGRVVDAEGKPDLLAKVEWTPGRKHGHTGGGTMTTNGIMVPNVQEVLKVDAQGQFELTEAGPGEHALRVRWSDWLTEDLVITLPADPPEPLVIERPRHGWLEGALDVPSGINPQEVRLTLQSNGSGSRSMAFMMHTSAIPQGLVIKGYSYRLGPLAPGRYEVQAYPQSAGGNRFLSNNDESLGQAKIRAGETAQLDLDVRSIFPGEVNVSVYSPGHPVSGAGMRLLGGDNGGSSGKTLDADGRASIPAVAAGRYTVMLETEAWSYDDPIGLSVRPGKTTNHEVEVPLATRTVRFVDTDGAPLERVDVTWACGRIQATKSVDRAGSLTLELVMGKVFFGLDGDVTVEVAWEAGEDALVVVLAAD